MNTPVDYSSRYSFGQFCCRVKQGKRLSEFLQKYPDSGTETTHLAGYNNLVYKYVKISAGLPLLFIGTIRERTNCYCGDWVLHELLPLKRYDLYSQILSVYELSIEVSSFFIFLGCFYFRKRKSADIYEKNIHFSSFLERPMETSRRNTAPRHRDNVHVYDK